MRYISNKVVKTPAYYDFKNKERAITKYVDYFLARTNVMFKYENLPDTIPYNFLEMYLQRNGVVAVTEVNGNLYAFTGNIGGAPNVYYFPENFIFANPALNISKTLRIGEECALVRNDSSYEGLMNLCCKYATLLAENDISMMISIINKRIPAIAVTHSDNTKQGLDMFSKHIFDGEFSIGIPNDFAESFITTPFSSNDTTRITDFIEFHNYTKASFFNEIGIRMSNNMKREALSEFEISSNDDFVRTLALDMLQCRQEDFDKVNNLYGTNIKVKFNNTWKDFDEEAKLDIDLKKAEIDTKENDEIDEDDKENGVNNDV